jgi:hypothetical protein
MRMNEKGELTLGKILGLVIAVIVGLILLPVVQDQVTAGQEWNNNSTDESVVSLLDVITLFYILGIVLGAVLYVVAETRGLGGN